MISIKGAKSHSLNRQRKQRCSNNCCKLTSKSNEAFDSGDENVFTCSRYSSWDDSRRHQCFYNSAGGISRTLSASNINSDSRREVAKHTERNTDEMPATKTDFKTLLSMFLKKSSIYALNQVGNSSSKKRKVFWAFIMVVGLLGSGIQIGQYLRSYFSYPVVINLDAVSTLNQEFPAVTVCNLNRIRKEYLPCLKNKLDYTECNLSVVKDIDLVESFTNDVENGTHCNAAFKGVNKEILTKFLWQSLFSKLNAESQEYYGHQKKNFISSCSFNGEECSADDFLNVLDFTYGNCFTFNMAGDGRVPLKTSFVGPNGGLELELDLEVEKYGELTRTVGARVEVHDPYHTALVSEKGINVSPGFETSIALSKYMMMRLSKPFKDNCVEYGVGEGVKMCTRRCSANATLTYCSCVLDKSFGDRQCDLTKLSDFCCVYGLPDLTCDCPLSCEDTDYTMSIFSAVWPAEEYYKRRPVNNTENNMTLSVEEVQKTRVKLKVYYDTLETSIFQQKPMYQSSEVLSQVGGQMGLWLGLSLVAIFECIENFVFLLRYRARNSVN